MKKIFSLVLVLVLAVSAMFVFTACGGTEVEPPVEETYYKVTYVYKNGDKTVELSTQQVSETAGFSAEQVAAVEKFKNNGYGFAGWYKDEACTEEFDFTAAVTADVTLYADRGSLAGDNIQWFVVPSERVTSTTTSLKYKDQSNANKTQTVVTGVTVTAGVDLCFVGNGPMYNFASQEDAPWHLFRTDILNLGFSGGITTIGDNTFCGLTKLLKVVLPAELTYVGANAFNGCTTLADVVTYDGANHLVNNVASRVYFPQGITEIGANAFANCTALPGVVYLPDKITSISDGMFFKCGKITDVVVPAGVTNVGATAFKDCNALKHVFFKGTEVAYEKITCGVDNYRFVDMSVVFYYSATDPEVAGPYWHYATDAEGKELGLRQWSFSIHYITAAANSGNKYIFTDYVEVDQETYKATCTEDNVTFRENMKVDGYTYLGFNKTLFTGTGDNKTWTVLTANVEHTAYRTRGISDGGSILVNFDPFKGTSLYSVRIELCADFDSETMTNRTWDFENLSATQFIWDKDGLPLNSDSKPARKSIRRDQIKTVTIGDGIEYLGAYSLANFAMEELSIPADVEEVHYTFVDNTTKLKTIYYEGTTALKVVDSTGKEVALNQPGVTIYTKYVAGQTDVTANGAYWTEIDGKKVVWNFQDGALTIGGAAEMPDFATAADAPWAAANITSVSFDAGITKIAQNVLNGDASVATIKLPSSVKVIPANAFAGTAAITNLAAAADGCGYIDGHLIKVVDASKIGERFNVPRNTYTIAEGAFEGITALKKIYVTRTVNYIAPDAFEGSGLTTVYFDGLPKTWEQIAAGVDADNVLYATIKTPTIANFMDYEWFKIDTETLAITELDLKEEDNVTITLKVVKGGDTSRLQEIHRVVNGKDTKLNDGDTFTIVVNKHLGGVLTDVSIKYDSNNNGKVTDSADFVSINQGWKDAEGNIYTTNIPASLLADGDVELTVVWPANLK